MKYVKLEHEVNLQTIGNARKKTFSCWSWKLIVNISTF